MCPSCSLYIYINLAISIYIIISPDSSDRHFQLWTVEHASQFSFPVTFILKLVRFLPDVVNRLKILVTPLCSRSQTQDQNSNSYSPLSVRSMLPRRCSESGSVMSTSNSDTVKRGAAGRRRCRALQWLQDE